MRLLLTEGRLADGVAGIEEVADVLIEDGAIARVGSGLPTDGARVLECAGKIVLPGFVDAHTHLREPGREDEETVASGTTAAVKGGFTAVCAMPNTDPPADNGAAVRFLVERAEAVGACRVHPVGSLTKERAGESLAEIGDMLEEGAIAFSDDGDAVADSGLMRLAMDYAGRFGTTVITHCEDLSLVAGGVVNEGRISTLLGLPGWPAAAEETIVARDIALAELTGCRLHLAHLSTAGSIDLVRQAKARGAQVTCEVTPHHLFLTEEDVGSYDTSKKMNPPLRTEEDRVALLEALADDTIDCIATDHAPHAVHEKELEFELAPFGTTGLETALSLVVTHLVTEDILTWSDVARLMAHGPRRALGLPGVTLSEGSVADLTVVDPEARVSVSADSFMSKSRNSAFLGTELVGRAHHVLVAGDVVLEESEVVRG